MVPACLDYPRDWGSPRSNDSVGVEKSRGRSSSRSPYIDTYFQRVDGIRRALDTSNISLRKSKFKRSLIFLLHQFGHFEATNPRDKIYGLLGLAEDAMTIHSVGNMSLGYLSFGAGVKRLPGLPSWAPDWTYTPYRLDNWNHLGRRKTYQLPNYHDVTPIFSEGLTALTVQGFIVAYLVDEGETPTGEDYEDDSGDADHIDVVLSSMENVVGAMYDRDREESESREFDLVPSHNNMLLPGPNQTCAHGVQKGDLFCMVVGASDPFILRRQLNGFELIGTAKDNTFYLVGWRRCVKLWEEGSLELMEFVLRWCPMS
ncbi:hypothetical protein B0J14DRAFT_631527 [Halenospora varia]|nr:hypothetical protein B0J14DRAFT_631527 [Halenospora varia]